MSKSQKRDPDDLGRWFRCPMEGCEFCHYDFLVISSDRMHMARAHPMYTKKFTELWNARIMISEAEGRQWRAIHPEAYRGWRKKQDYVPGKNARPRPGKNADPAPAPGAGRAPVQADNLRRPSVIHGQQYAIATSGVGAAPIPDQRTRASEPDAMNVDTPGKNPAPRPLSPKLIFLQRDSISHHIDHART